MLMRVYVIWQKFRDGVVCQCFPIPPKEVALLRSLKVFFRKQDLLASSPTYTCLKDPQSRGVKWEEVGSCRNLMLSNVLALEIATYAQSRR